MMSAGPNPSQIRATKATAAVVVVLEPEPAAARHLVGAPRVAGRLTEMEEDVRARRSERDERQAAGDRQPPPRPPGGDGQRYEQQDARVLRARREADGEAGELDPARRP